MTQQDKLEVEHLRAKLRAIRAYSRMLQEDLDQLHDRAMRLDDELADKLYADNAQLRGAS